MNANHLAAAFDETTTSLLEQGKWLLNEEKFEKGQLPQFLSAVEKLRDRFDNLPIEGGKDEFSAIAGEWSEIKKSLNAIERSFNQAITELEFIARKDKGFLFNQGSLDMMQGQVLNLWNMANYSPEAIVEKGIGHEARNNLLGNFPVRNISSLSGLADTSLGFDIGDIGRFVLQDEGIEVAICAAGLRKMQHSRVLYLESPLLWRLARPLKSAGRKGFLPFSKRVSQVPKYFYDMMAAIGETGRGDTQFPDVLKDLTDEISGRIEVNEAGDFFYKEKVLSNYTMTMPLSLAALGVANFGMLGLLIEKNLLDENTFLFVDEPEAHLHPAWQVAMTKVLIHLAERGVKVVMATHSADILKWMEIYVKENPEAEDLFALNHFADGTVKSGDGFREELGGILDDLTTPYQHMFIRGLRA